jgi:ParB family chromosome partitioning protein
MNKRKTIGRTLIPSAINGSDEPAQAEENRIFTLNTGKKVSFKRLPLSFDEIKNKTFVREDINGRDQSALTAESLLDITSTLKDQQFFPVIGVLHPDGRIELLDGSRRRASALLLECGLEALLTRDSITTAEARALAKSIQTAKEHTLRDIGLRLQKMKSSGVSQKSIAELEGFSQSKVTRALQAAAVSSEILTVFPDQSQLTHPDYKALLDVEEICRAEGIEIELLIQNHQEEFDNLSEKYEIAEDLKNAVLSYLKRVAAQINSVDTKEKAVITPLWTFTDKNRYARKRTSARAFTYEFNRLPQEVQAELDLVIEKIMNSHFGK